MTEGFDLKGHQGLLGLGRGRESPLFVLAIRTSAGARACLLALYSMNCWPAASIKAANARVTIALASCEISFMALREALCEEGPSATNRLPNQLMAVIAGELKPPR
jgi:hypothetical protein